MIKNTNILLAPWGEDARRAGEGLLPLELLAPAKNLECGIAAIDHGADAVYIGAQRFGARAAAGNSVEDIATLCKYAHQFGAKVFVTVNTIIYDEELNDTLQLVDELDSIGVDAILVQDMGLFSLLKQRKEPLHCELHASTQTDNRTAEKVKWLFDQGFDRVVLARELSIEEISNIHNALSGQAPSLGRAGEGVFPLEVFVHGALCVSYSGQCYASQYCFQRSANRGECAQFCRLAFTLKDANGKVLESERHLLSLRDMAQINNLEKLAEAGASSFKIEGRLKDVDYVKNITAAYSEALNEVVRRNPDKYARASFGKCTYTFTPNIQKSFNRGFTTYFAEGRKQGLVSFDTPKAMGEPVGKVKEIRGHSFNISTTTSFANGDGLCYLTPTGLVGFRVNKVEGNRIFPLRMPESLKPGTMLFRNLDQAFTTLLAKPSSERKIDISFHLYEENGKLTLTAKDEVGRTATVQSDCELHPAAKPQEENIRRQLSKLGGTIYQCKDIEIDTKAFIPSSVLANMRREIIEEMYNVQFTKYNSHPSPNTQHPTPTYPTPYLYNASNRKAKEFYKEQGIEAESFEISRENLDHSGSLSTGEGGGRGHFLLMQCRYCLRNEMGFCTKSGKRAPWKEPLTISISDGREFQLQFDCKNCQMNVVSINN